MQVRRVLVLTMAMVALLAAGASPASAVADLSIAPTAGQADAGADPSDASDRPLYRWTVTNTGPDEATGIEVVLAKTGVAGAFGPVTWNGAAMACSAPVSDWECSTVVPLASGATAQLVVQATYSGAGSASIQPTVTSAITDPNPGNNQASAESTTVTAAENDAPVCTESTPAQLRRHWNDATTFDFALPSCTDLDGDTLTLEVTPGAAAAHGAVSFPDGPTLVPGARARWAPEGDYRGTDGFRVRATDGSTGAAAVLNASVHRYENAALEYTVTAPESAEALLAYTVSVKVANNGSEAATRPVFRVTVPGAFAASGSACTKVDEPAGAATYECLPGVVGPGAIVEKQVSFVPNASAAGSTATVVVAGLVGSADTASTNGAPGGALTRSVPVKSVSFVFTTPPSLSNEPTAGGSLRCAPGVWNRTPASTSYAWLVNGVVDPTRGTGDVILLTWTDVGKTLACRVTATYGSLTATADTTPVTGRYGTDFRGTSGNDTFIGTNKRNVARGGSGNDTLRCLGGNDRCDGGAGNDKVDCGAGNDTCLGGPGKDTVTCGPGKDKGYGDAGNDVLRCKDGKPGDLIDGGAGRDTCHGDRKDRFVRCERIRR
jgi:Ca2+-binding RTX toxin-like protein